MAKRKMLVSTCDQCHKEDKVPLDRLGRKKFVLPPKWMHVEATTAAGPVFGLDLCDDCVKPVLKAAGRYRAVSGE